MSLLTELEKTNKRITNIDNRLRNIENKINTPSDFISSSNEKYNLDENEKLVFEYIQNNPHTNKESIAKNFEKTHQLSRGPVFKCIKKLIESKLIIEEINAKNRHSKVLMVNENNIFIKFDNQLKNFKESFLKVTKTLKQKKLEGTENEKRLRVLMKLYNKFIEDCLFRGLPIYTGEIKNKQILFEMYKIFINTIIEIQLELNKIDHYGFTSIPYDRTYMYR